MKFEDLQKQIKCNRNAEFRLLGALIAIGKHEDIRAQEIMTRIDDQTFFFNESKVFFEVIKNNFKRRHNFDFLSIQNQIPNDYSSLFDSLYDEKYLTTNHIEQDINDLLHLKSLRLQIPVLIKTLMDCHLENSPSNCLDILTTGIHEISNHYNNNSISVVETYEEIIDRIADNAIDTDITLDLNMLTFPPLPTCQMITIAGRSGTGKTYFAIYLLDRIARVSPDKQTLYFNLEMKPEQIVHRHSMLVTDKDGQTKNETILKAAPTLLNYDFKIISQKGITIEEIETISRVQSMKKPISVIVVDYIGLVHFKKRLDAKSKHLEQSEIASRLAELAGSLNCIVICLLQVNRDHKLRSVGDKCPYPTDSAESLGCERSSALWMGIDRPEIDSEEERYKHLFIIKNRKSRGDTGFFTEYMSFKDGRFYEINQIDAQRKIDNTITNTQELGKPKY